MATKWGIVGAGKITHDFCIALKTLPQQDHEIIAVAARDLDRAQEYAKRLGITKSYGSYEELARDPDIEIAYIGVYHEAHYDASKLFLNNGKHVLCEKPLTTNARTTKELIRLAKEKGLFLMEGFWSRFFPSYDKVRSELPLLGNVKLVTALFTSNADEQERVKNRNAPGGGIYDYGCYLIQFATLIYGCKPEKITCEGNIIAPGADESCCIILRYSGGRFAHLGYQAGVTAGNNNAQIIGVKGSIELMTPFWCSSTVRTPTDLYKYPIKGGEHPFNYPFSLGFIYEARCVRECLKKGYTECPLMSHEHSVIVAEVTEDIVKQLDIK